MITGLANPKTTIIEMLKIVKYDKNPEEMANKIMVLCHYEACKLLIELLPESERLTLKPVGETNLQELRAKLRRWFSIEDYVMELEEAVYVTFKKLFQNLLPTLTEQQKIALGGLAGRLRDEKQGVVS